MDLSNLATPVASAITLPASYAMNQQNAATAQKYTRENMETSMRNQTALMRLATPLAVQGMRDAGLNPSALAGGERPMSVPSAPQGAKPDAPDMAASLQMAQMQSVTALNNAEAKKAEAEAVKISYENKHTVTADSVFRTQMLDNMQEIINLYKQKGVDTSKLESQYNDLFNNPDFDIGGFVGSMKAYEQQAGSLENFVQRIESLLKAAGAYKILEDKPTLYGDMQIQKYALDLAQAYYLSSSANVNEATLDKLASEVKNLDEQVNLYKSQGKLNEVQAKNIYNNDVNTLINDGKVGEAVRAELVNGVNSFAHGAGQGAGFAAGAALTKGSGVLSAVGGVGSSRLGGLARSGVETFKHVASPFKKGTKDALTFDLLAHRIGEDNAKDILGKFLASKERKLYSSNFTSWLGAYNRSNGKYPK